MGRLPLFPLEVVLFPGMSLPLHVFEPRYKQMVAECLERKGPFGVVLETDGERCAVGCSAAILEIVHRYPDGRLDIATEGKQRFRVLEVDEEIPYLRGKVEWLEERHEETARERAEVLELYRRTFWLHGQGVAPSALESAASMSYLIARSSLLGLRERQKLLEIGSERERLVALRDALARLEPVARRVSGNGRHG